MRTRGPTGQHKAGHRPDTKLTRPTQLESDVQTPHQRSCRDREAVACRDRPPLGESTEPAGPAQEVLRPITGERKKTTRSQHPPKSNSTLSEGREKGGFERSTHPPRPPVYWAVHSGRRPAGGGRSATIRLAESLPRVARPRQKSDGLRFRDSGSGQSRRLESTGRVVHLRLHTRGGGGGDAGGRVNLRVSAARRRARPETDAGHWPIPVPLSPRLCVGSLFVPILH